MTESNENAVVAGLAGQAIVPQPLTPGTVYAVADGEGKVKVVDVDPYGVSPRRKTAARVVSDSKSFADYLAKHGEGLATEVYADTPRSTIYGIIDSHAGADLPSGWQDHKVTLKLETTKSWDAWIGANGHWFTQTDFAEFIEQRATDVVEPAAGDLMALAQEFYMTKGVEYESSQRLADGQTTLVYKEKVATKGLGNIEVPKELKLALQPYVGGVRQYAFAAFRTKLEGATLLIGFVLIRPEEIVEGAFADIVTELIEGRAPVERREGEEGRPGVVGRPGFDPIGIPIYFGKPQ